MDKINCKYLNKFDNLEFIEKIIKKYGETVYCFVDVYQIKKESKDYLFELCVDYDEHLEDYYLFSINDFEVKQLKFGKYELEDFKYIKDIEKEIQSKLINEFGDSYKNNKEKFLLKKKELKKQYEDFELNY